MLRSRIPKTSKIVRIHVRECSIFPWIFRNVRSLQNFAFHRSELLITKKIVLQVYPMKKYLFIFLIVLGVIVFMYKDGKTSVKQSDGQFGIGEFLLLLSLTMDGLTSAVQERMRAEHKTKSGHMMVNMNLWSIFFSGAVILASGELLECGRFLQRHPNTMWDILTFSLAGALGQYFIFLTVADFGPLPCSIITTTRKFFTVLGSVLLFGNNLLPRQWIGTFVVFCGLLLDALYGKDKPMPKKELMK